MKSYIKITPYKSISVIMQEITHSLLQTANYNFLNCFCLELVKKSNLSAVLVGYFQNDKIITLSFVLNQQLQENFEYEYSEYPCIEVLKFQKNFFCENFHSSYPKAFYFQQIGVSHYFGVPIFQDNQKLIGLIAFFSNDEEILNTSMTVLDFFYKRISIEIENSLKEKFQKIQNEELTNLNTQLQESLNEKSRELENISQLLDKSNAKLIEQDKMATLGILSAGVSHEIKNSLSYILASIEGIQILWEDHSQILRDMQFKLKQHGIEENFEQEIHSKQEEIKKDFEILYKNTKKGIQNISNLVKSLKEYSHPSQENFEKANLHDLIYTSINMLQHELKNDMQIELQLDSNISEILCIPNKLIQVFVNLIQNAIQAKRKTETGKIIVKTSYIQKLQSFSTINIEIIDDGAGISKENISKIFQPFFTTKSSGKGVGLGLFISHEIIEKHDGTLKVESKENEGATFIIELPIK